MTMPMEWLALDQICEMLQDDPIHSAETAGLRYASDEEPGIRRKRWGRGFTYLDQKGNRITDPKSRQRFEKLTIPPAWSDVWIAPAPEYHIQATGRDEENRKQYIYHLLWNEVRRQYHFNRLVAFGYSLPVIRQASNDQIIEKPLDERTMIAAIVKLLDETQARIGNPVYAEKNETYGLTTLRRRHLQICGSTVQLDFIGKSGKQIEVNIKNRCLARILGRCCEATGWEIFSYRDEQGRRRRISAMQVNDYLREVSGVFVTAKDFRPWSGTARTVAILEKTDWTESESKRKKNLVEAVKEVAKNLTNTPAVCRQHYIHPAIFQSYDSGEFFKIIKHHTLEKANIPARLRLLRKCERVALQIIQKAFLEGTMSESVVK